MPISFLTSTNIEETIYLTFDPSVDLSEEQKASYLSTGVLEGEVKEDATKFTITALSPSDREEAEVRAGSYTRSELGRILWIEAPIEEKEKAKWHHNLDQEERSAFGQYQSYLNQVYLEMIRSSLVRINDQDASLDLIQSIRPESHRVQAITELVLHIQRISLVGEAGK